MKIATSILMGGLIAVAGSVLYDTTFEVQELENQLSRINRQIVAEREVIQVLKADWSLLNDINRIETLSVRYLPELRPAEAGQFVALKTLPMRGNTGTEPQVAALSTTGNGAGSSNGNGAAAKGNGNNANHNNANSAGPAKAPALKPPVSTPQGDALGSLIAKVGVPQ